MKRTSYDVIVAGHICFDVIPRLLGAGEDFFKAFKPGKLIDIGEAAVSTGGPVSNTGIGLLKLGAKTSLMGKVGTDFFGRAILEKLREIGLDKSMTVVEGEHTSYTLAITPPKIDRIFLHCRGTNNTFGFEDVNYDIVAKTKVFHFGYPPLMKRIYEHNGAELTRIFQRAKEAGATTSLDMALPDPSSPAGKEDWDQALRNTLPFVDLYLPSGEETLFMLDRKTFTARRAEAGRRDVLDCLHYEDLAAVAAKVLAYGAKVVVLKCGHLGMYVRTAPLKALQDFGAWPPRSLEHWADRELWEPAFHVENVASATGSGDSAIAGFLAAYVRGLSLEQCLKYGCAVGAFNVTAFDAVSGIKSWDETTQAIEAGWGKKPVPLLEREPQWRFDAAARTWHGPLDRRV